MGTRQELDFDTRVVMLWSTFAGACRMDFDVAACVDEAKTRRREDAKTRSYDQNVQNNLPLFPSDKE